MKKILFTLALLISFSSFGQDYRNSKDALKLCSVLQSNNFVSDSQAEKALNRILFEIGASKRFVLQSCDNINNAVATSYKGVRYILYDRDFMYSISSGNNWGNLFILAHEVGHHINGHSVDLVLYFKDIVEPKSLASKRKQELEADEFAGFILARLGATLSQATKTINSIASNKSDTYSTHPSKSKRLNSVRIGYNKGKNNNTINKSTTNSLGTQYYYDGLDKYNLKDYKGAIVDFTKAIQINPNNSYYYFYRAYSKFYLKDYKGSIADYTRAIELDPKHEYAYNNRGNSKKNLKDYYGAISDYTRAIELDPNNALFYEKRGVLKRKLKDETGAQLDFKKALSIKLEVIDTKPNDAYEYTEIADLYYKMNDFTKAKTASSKAIELEPNDGYGYFLRAWHNYKLNEISNACIDIKKAIELGYESESLAELIGLTNCTP